MDHQDAYLFELARKNVYDFLLLSLVGVDEVLLTFACRGARLRVSPDGGRQRHGSQGPEQQCRWRLRYISGFAETVAGDRSAQLALVTLKKLILLTEGTKLQWAGVTTNRPT